MSLHRRLGRFKQTEIARGRYCVRVLVKSARGRLLAAARAANDASIALCLCVLISSCGTEATRDHEPDILSRTLAPWVFANTDGTAFTANDVAGRTTIVLFLTTYDTASQIAANRLDACLHSLARRTNAIAVAMEPPDHAVLVGAFHDSLRLSYPVLMPDPATLAGQGPFGMVEVVPTWIVLDSSGREIWRGVGVRALPQLRKVLVRMGNAAETHSQGCG